MSKAVHRRIRTRLHRWVRPALRLGSSLPLIGQRIYALPRRTPTIDPSIAGTVIASEDAKPNITFAPDRSGLCSVSVPSPVTFPEARIVSLEDASVRTKADIAFRGSSAVVWDQYGPWEANRERLARFTPRWLPRVRHIDAESIFLRHRQPHNYYHFMVDISVRLQFCISLGYTPERIFVCAPLLEWQAEIFRAYGIPERCLNEVDSPFNLRFRRLVIVSPASLRLGLSDNMSLYRPDVIRAHADAIKHHVGTSHDQSTRRLYVTRRGQRRSLSNEDEVEAIAKRAGFEAVDPGSLTLHDQVRAFSEAEAILGVHGAAMTNMLFAPRQCRIGEILPESRPSPTYAHFAQITGQSYTAMVGDAVVDGLFDVDGRLIRDWIGTLQ